MYMYMCTHNIYKIFDVPLEMLCYAGKDESLDCTGRNHTHAVVMALVEKLSGRGHHIYTDNTYSSPALFAELREKSFCACGTVRVNRRGLPAPVCQGGCVFSGHR